MTANKYPLCCLTQGGILQSLVFHLGWHSTVSGISTGVVQYSLWFFTWGDIVHSLVFRLRVKQYSLWCFTWGSTVQFLVCRLGWHSTVSGVSPGSEIIQPLVSNLGQNSTFSGISAGVVLYNLWYFGWEKHSTVSGVSVRQYGTSSCVLVGGSMVLRYCSQVQNYITLDASVGGTILQPLVFQLRVVYYIL